MSNVNLSAALAAGTTRRVASVVNGASSGGVVQTTSMANANVKVTSTGALTAGVLTTALSISGRGALNFIAATRGSLFDKTVRIKVTIDGRVIFDATSTNLLSSELGLVALGRLDGTFQPVVFTTSALVEVACNNTAAITLLSNYEIDV